MLPLMLKENLNLKNEQVSLKKIIEYSVCLQPWEVKKSFLVNAVW